MIVCVKPAGILSQSDEKGRANMISLLQEKTGGTVYPVHRLDKETGGVMVYAKTPDAAAELSGNIAEHRMEKVYLALVHGIPDNNGEMRDFLFRDMAKNKSYVVSGKRRGVKEAILTHRLLATEQIDGEPFSLVVVRLQTGRTHQIRVQFSHRKMPLAGDRKYGGKDRFSQLQLWSYRLTLNHPGTNESLTFSALPESEIMKMILGKYQNGEN